MEASLKENLITPEKIEHERTLYFEPRLTGQRPGIILPILPARTEAAPKPKP